MNYDDRFNRGAQTRTQSAPPRGQQIATLEPPEFAVTELGQARIGGVALVPQSVAEIAQFATMMAASGKMVRKHLRDNAGTCLGLCMQAFRWGMDPYMVANASYEVNDQIAYEAKLLNAVIIQNAPIVGRPVYSYVGEGQARRCTVEVATREGQKLSLETPAKGNIKPQNSPLWMSDPDQQLSYYAIRALARRYFPDILMGCYDLEEAAAMTDVTPKPEIAPPQERRAAAALDGLQARRGKTTKIIEADPAPAEPEEEASGSDGAPEHDEDGVIQDVEEDGEADAVDGVVDTDSIEIPQMPDDALSMWEGKGRWTPGWKWLQETIQACSPPIAVHLLMTHDDIVSAAAGYSPTNKGIAAEMRKKAGL